MSKIPEQLVRVQKRLRAALAQSGRGEQTAQLVAVSKTKPAADIRSAYQAGQRLFGESYLQEALVKQQALSDLDIEWHFIGPLQSNKTRAVAENFDWVHSLDRVKIAARLNEQRPAHLPPLNVCLQVNLDDEASKAGVTLDEVDALLVEVAEMPRLRVRGLMAIPAPRQSPVEQRAAFAPLTAKFKTLQVRYPQLDTLSIGMSADLEAAVAEGATLVRVGTDIFGQRD